ncbi:beta-hexosaminidase [Pedobacter yulinensis]|uniref:beta-N-acetylhexosaminidase n=1 Tax=Pedobacter yulinensis TaxID=2126353 RepID=A0A2T3HM34_9SPHI|nr:beta-N-acetylhexosaminidase [Pedobacter yulinensis]PST83512.1 beta-hexosaminidase [Pedobacter yulinensis]
MRILFFALLLLLATGSSGQQLSLVPYPKTLVPLNGSFRLDEKGTVFPASSTVRPLDLYLRQEIFKVTRQTLRQAPREKQAAIVLSLTSAKGRVPGAYKLTIASRQISIRAGDQEGLFNGIQTLLQLIRLANAKGVVTLTAMHIEDEPLYSWRGLMLDESRHFFGKEKVKQLLDWMAVYKLNRFHWHLTDEPGWRMEIKRYPRLTLVGGIGNHTDSNQPARYYTQEDVREIVAYAATRFIAVIPEVDMPGHATAANRAYPEYSGGGTKAHPEFTFNAGHEPTYSYLTNILKETQLLFPSNLIHLGGDEVRFAHDGWKANQKITALKQRLSLATEVDVEKYFMKRMADSVFNLGAKVLVWDEMVRAGLPVDQTIIFWWRHDKPAELEHAIGMGYQTVLCPRLPLYFDFVQDSTHLHGRKWGKQFNDLLSVYRYDPTGQPLRLKSQNILGLQANLWTETIQNSERLDFLTFPRLAALAEACWSNPGQRNETRFLTTLKTHLSWYREAGLHFYDPFKPSESPEPASRKRIEQSYID